MLKAPKALPNPDIEWHIAVNPVGYTEAVTEMERRVAEIEAGTSPELIWLLEHPNLYTAGTSAGADELIDAQKFPVFASGRGGRYTYHGPGQRIVYALCDLRKRDRDIRAHVQRLEEWIIRVLADFDIEGGRREDRIGIWVMQDGLDKKIAAIGVRVRHWIAYHGLSLNINPELEHYKGIVPCGLSTYGVTSMQDLGVKVSRDEVDQSFRRHADGLMF